MLLNEDISFNAFKDCLLIALTSQSNDNKVRKKRTVRKERSPSRKDGKEKNENGPEDGSINQDPKDLSDFIEYIAEEIFPSLPSDLQTLSFHTMKQDVGLEDRYSVPLSLSTVELLVDPLPPTVSDTLVTYGVINPPATDLHTFLNPVLTSFIVTVTAQPPPPSTTRAMECEICSRDWITLTYHHLIPKQVHAKALKRGWHEEHVLNQVAWLCRACHSFVHRMASNEELAREYFTVDRILEREDVQKWAAWVGRVRWKKR